MKNTSYVVRGLTVTVLAAVTLTLGACVVEPADDGEGDEEAIGETMSEVTSAKTVGDWSKLPTGQECLAALQEFYPAKFGVSLPIAGPGSTGNCASHGACHLWLDKIPSSAEWERIPNDGKHEPTTYDLIVYPPISGDPWGHIASVDHVEGKTIFVMDDNYVAHHQKSTHPHTVSWPAYGWYHLKKLGASPAPKPSSCSVGGLYCGGDKVSGSSSTLYRCESGGPQKVRSCAHGCEVVSGKDDACGCVPHSFYCGGDVVTGSSDSLYECGADGVSVKLAKACAKGCQIHSGSDDACR